VQDLTTLVKDDSLVRSERKKAKVNKDKFTGQGSLGHTHYGEFNYDWFF